MRRRSPFAGLNLGRASDGAPGLTRDFFKELGLGRAAASVAAPPAPLDRAVQDYARRWKMSGRWGRQGLDTLMRMENGYDIAQARKREDQIKVAPFKG